MKPNEANETRLLAAELIRQLYEAKQQRQLELLELQVKRSLEELNAADEGRAESARPKPL